MISISVHFASFLIGICVGVLAGACCSFSALYDQRWELGFGEGWQRAVDTDTVYLKDVEKKE